jgi:hypothetical protein
MVSVAADQHRGARPVQTHAGSVKIEGTVTDVRTMATHARRLRPWNSPDAAPARWPGPALTVGRNLAEATAHRQAEADDAELETFRYYEEFAARHHHLGDPLKVRAAASRRVISCLAALHPEVLRSAVEAARAWPEPDLALKVGHPSSETTAD